MALRPLEPGDFPFLMQIENDAFSSGYSPYFLREMPILFGNSSYIAIAGREPQGYVAAAREQGSRRGWILSLAVRPQYRKQGLGRALMKAGLEGLAAVGAREVFLSVAPSNEGAIALYEKLGFSRGEIVADYFGPGEDRLIMMKDLTSGEVG